MNYTDSTNYWMAKERKNGTVGMRVGETPVAALCGTNWFNNFAVFLSTPVQ